MSVSVAPAFKLALVNALISILPAGTLVTYGHPGAQSAPDMVGVLGVESAQDLATMGTPRRREETLTATVMFSCFRGGTDQQAVTEAAYALLGTLETYLQDSTVSPSTQVTLGGVVREARVTDHILEESYDEEVMALGRLAEITATVTAHVRI